MAGKTTRVTAIIGAKVEGDKELQDLAKQLAKLPDEQDIEVGARVTGGEDVDGLAKTVKALPDKADVKVGARVTGDDDVADLSGDLDALPSSVDAGVSAKVTGAQDVADLDSDLSGLPGSTDADVAAEVTGNQEVADLSTDLKALPATTSVKADVATTGNDKLDALVADLAALPPSKTVTVSAQITGGGGGKDSPIRKFQGELDDVGDSAGDAGGGISALGSEITSTLGGSFSEGIGVAGDFAEQFRNIRDQVNEAGGGMKNWAKAVGGIGATIGVGLLLTPLLEWVGSLSEAAEETTAAIDGIADAWRAAGGTIDAGIIEDQITELADSDAFKGVAIGLQDVLTIEPKLTLKALSGDVAAYESIVADAQKRIENRRKAGDPEGVQDAKKALGDFRDLYDQRVAIIEGGSAKGAAVQEVINERLAQEGLTLEENTSKIEQQAGFITTTAGAWEAYHDAAEGGGEAQAWLDEQVAELQAVADGYNDAALAAVQFAVDNDGVHTALAESSEAASEAADRLNFFKLSMDEISGSTEEARDSVFELGGVLQDMEGFKGQAGIATRFEKGGLAALAATESGQAFYGMLKDGADVYADTSAAAYELALAEGKTIPQAQKALRTSATETYDQMIKSMTANGQMSEETAADILKQVGIVNGADLDPKTLELLADDTKVQNALDEVEAQKLKDKELKVLGDLTKVLEALAKLKGIKIDGKTQKVDGDITDAQDTLRILRNDTLRDKVQKIKGDKTDVDTKIQQLTALGIPPKEAKIIAETSGLSDAEAAIQRVADGSYQAEIDVKANPIGKAWDYLFGGLGTYTASVPPPRSGLSAGVTAEGAAAPVGLSVLAAPRISPRVSATAQAPGGISITVNGALDPPAVARQINQVLTRAQRRTGPIRAGGSTELRAPV